MAGDEEISFIPRFISERSMKNARRLQKKMPRVKTMREAIKLLRVLVLKTGGHRIAPYTPMTEVLAKLKAHARRTQRNHQGN